MIENYLNTSEQLRAVFLLVDIRHEASKNDVQMYQWMLEMGFYPIIIATKLDKLKRSQVQKSLKILKESLGVVKDTIVIPFSAVTKQGKDEILDLIEEICED